MGSCAAREPAAPAECADGRQKSRKDSPRTLPPTPAADGGGAKPVSEVRGEGGQIDRVGDYDLDIHLGTGAYGRVHAVRHSRGCGSGATYAMKMLDKRRLTERQLSAHGWLEVRLLSLLTGHSCVVAFQDVMESDSFLYIVIEYVHGVDLLTIVRRDAPLTEFRAKLFYKAAVEGLQHCHSRLVVHRDVKPENLLVCRETGVAKLSDFGLGAILSDPDELLHDPCGTPHFVAPEVLGVAEAGYRGPPVDVWSAAVLLFNMLTRRLPFDCRDRALSHRDRLSALYDCIRTGRYDAAPLEEVGAADDVFSLFDAVFVLDAAARPTCGQVLRHPWLAPTRVGRPRLRRAGSLRRSSSVVSLDDSLRASKALMDSAESIGAPGVVGKYVLGVPLGTDHLGAVHACTGSAGAWGADDVCGDGLRRRSLIDLDFHPVAREAAKANPFSIRRLDQDRAGALQLLQNEVSILSRIECENIIKVWESFAFGGAVWTVMDLIIGDNLLRVVQTREASRRSFKRQLHRYLHQLVRTVAFLHQEGIVHQRLRLECAMLDHVHDSVVLTDFSAATTGRPVWERYAEAEHGFLLRQEHVGPLLVSGTDFENCDDVARLAISEGAVGFAVSADGRAAKLVHSYSATDEPPAGTWRLHVLDASDRSDTQGPFDKCPNDPAYHPPELASAGSYRGEEGDMWALGVLLYGLCEPGCEPFSDVGAAPAPGSPETRSRLLARKNRHDMFTSQPEQAGAGGGDGPPLSADSRLTFRSVRDSSLQALLSGLLCVDPASRLTARRALDHPYFTEKGMPTQVPHSPVRRESGLSDSFSDIVAAFS